MPSVPSGTCGSTCWPPRVVVEALADLCTEEFHPLAKIAKDTAAGAVLISSVTALGVGAAIFLPRLLRSPG